MCYDIQTSLEAQLKRAKRNKDLSAIQEIKEKLAPLTDLPLYHASGFSHPKLFIYTNDSPYFPKVATWGLVPCWVKDVNQQKKIWNSTLNARIETLFDKPSFRDSVRTKRCIIHVDGFYEHHHRQKEVFPYYIQQKTKEPMTLAGLWSEWPNPETKKVLFSFTIVTTKGNEFMSEIHNNPKLDGPRMPLILSAENENSWLANEDEEVLESKIKALKNSSPEVKLIAHTVGKLRGKTYAGNQSTVSEPIEYPQLSSLLDL